MQTRIADTIVSFVRGDPLLQSTYLLHAAGGSGFEPGSPESVFAFLLWFVVHRLRSYAAPLVLPGAVLDALASLDAAGTHPLMRTLAEAERRELSGDALRSWYYREGVPQHRLAPLLGRAELAGLAARSGDLGTGLAPPISPAETFYRATITRLAAEATSASRVPRVSIVGFHRSVLGLGEDARCLFDCCVHAGIAAELVDISLPGLERSGEVDRFRPFEAERPTASLVIFCMPAFEMMRAIANLGFFRPAQPQRRIGYWPWETTALAPEWRLAYDFVDEIWASSTFLGELYAADTDKPVVHMPLNVQVEDPVLPDDLASLFGDGFTALSVFDLNSRIERKNPLGSIAAFRQAFPPEIRDVRLVLKTLNLDRRAADLHALEGAIEGDDRVVIVDGPLPRRQICGLIAAADVYLSLHRSEGFGRPLAEAMLLGTPVVATRWSGPADFLDEETGFPVRSTLRRVGPEEYPFAAGSWAEPDIGEAARHLRDLYGRRGRALPSTAKARRRILERFSVEAIAALLRTHLADRFGERRSMDR